MKTALVTGATGYIGGKLAARLRARGCEVHVLLRPGSNAGTLPAGCVAHACDGSYVQVLAAVQASAPDAVFHLASQVLVQHQPGQLPDLLQANVALPAFLAEAMVACGVPCLVNTGTSWQRADGDAYSPFNLYAATKQAAEDLLHHYHRSRGLSCVTLELFDTYGIDDPRRKLLNLIRDTVRAGATLDMTAGEQVMDLTHVDDVADAFVCAARWLLARDTPCLERRSVSGERLVVRDLVHMVEAETGGRGFSRLGALPYRAGEIMQPPAPLAAVPGWQRQRNVRDDFVRLISGGTAA